MGDFLGAKIEGGEEMLKQMKALGLNTRKVLAAATRAGLKVVQVEAEQNAKGISSRGGKATRLVLSSKKPTHATADLGPGKKKWYLRFFETGAQPHEISGPLAFEGDRGLVLIGGVSHPGMSAQPWLRPAFGAKRDAARDAFGETVRAAIEEARLAAEGQDDPE